MSFSHLYDQIVSLKLFCIEFTFECCHLGSLLFYFTSLYLSVVGDNFYKVGHHLPSLSYHYNNINVLVIVFLAYDGQCTINLHIDCDTILIEHIQVD